MLFRSFSEPSKIIGRFMSKEEAEAEEEKLKNLFNNSEEVRENTNASIKYIRKQANTLHLTLSNNMKYEV